MYGSDFLTEPLSFFVFAAFWFFFCKGMGIMDHAAYVCASPSPCFSPSPPSHAKRPCDCLHRLRVCAGNLCVFSRPDQDVHARRGARTRRTLHSACCSQPIMLWCWKPTYYALVLEGTLCFMRFLSCCATKCGVTIGAIRRVSTLDDLSVSRTFYNGGEQYSTLSQSPA